MKLKETKLNTKSNRKQYNLATATSGLHTSVYIYNIIVAVKEVTL